LPAGGAREELDWLLLSVKSKKKKNPSKKLKRKNSKKIFSNDFFSLTLWHQSIPPPRFLFPVYKSLGKAVTRNRLKRVFREFVRRNKDLIPHHDVICRPRPQAAKVKNPVLFKALQAIFQEAHLGTRGAARTE